MTKFLFRLIIAVIILGGIYFVITKEKITTFIGPDGLFPFTGESNKSESVLRQPESDSAGDQASYGYEAESDSFVPGISAEYVLSLLDEEESKIKKERAGKEESDNFLENIFERLKLAISAGIPRNKKAESFFTEKASAFTFTSVCFPSFKAVCSFDIFGEEPFGKCVESEADARFTLIDKNNLLVTRCDFSGCNDHTASFTVSENYEHYQPEEFGGYILTKEVLSEGSRISAYLEAITEKLTTTLYAGYCVDSE